MSGDGLGETITLNGRTLRIETWSNLSGTHAQVIRKRLRNGWRPADAVWEEGTSVELANVEVREGVN